MTLNLTIIARRLLSTTTIGRGNQIKCLAKMSLGQTTKQRHGGNRNHDRSRWAPLLLLLSHLTVMPRSGVFVMDYDMNYVAGDSNNESVRNYLSGGHGHRDKNIISRLNLEVASKRRRRWSPIQEKQLLI